MNFYGVREFWDIGERANEAPKTGHSCISSVFNMSARLKVPDSARICDIPSYGRFLSRKEKGVAPTLGSEQKALSNGLGRRATGSLGLQTDQNSKILTLTTTFLPYMIL
jgi:hypothetical protein